MNKAFLKQEIGRLERLAKSEDWSTREEGGFATRDLMEQEFDSVFALTKSWAHSKSERLRRAACLACMQRKKITNEQRVKKVLSRLRFIMRDESIYVRKCCGPFVVGYLGYTYPAIVLPWLKQQANNPNLNVKTNVAKAFSQALGRQHPQTALEILAILHRDERSRVRQAVMQSLRNISRSSILSLAQKRKLSAYLG